MLTKHINKAQEALEKIFAHYGMDGLSAELYEATQAIQQLKANDIKKLSKRIYKLLHILDITFIELDNAIEELNCYESDFDEDEQED